jgi:hypothetical protein
MPLPLRLSLAVLSCVTFGHLESPILCPQCLHKSVVQLSLREFSFFACRRCSISPKYEFFPHHLLRFEEWIYQKCPTFWRLRSGLRLPSCSLRSMSFYDARKVRSVQHLIPASQRCRARHFRRMSAEFESAECWGNVGVKANRARLEIATATRNFLLPDSNRYFS